jgi:hypothetical protein
MNPSETYKARLEDRRTRLGACQRAVRLISYVRLAFGISFFATLWMAFSPQWFSGWIALAPLAIYIGLAIYHERLHRLGRRLHRSVGFFERALDRVEDRWMGGGNTDTSFSDPAHLYARDLDIFGKGSLFDLLCTARTRAGEETLARWLCASASRSEILERQEAIRELRDNVDLREDLAVLGPEIQSAVHPDVLKEWALAPTRFRSVAPRIVAPILAAATVGLLIYCLWTEGFFHLFSGTGGMLLRYALFVEIGFAWIYRKAVSEVVAGIDKPAKELAVLGLALARVEREHFSSEKLRQLQNTVSTSDAPASKHIRSLVSLVETLNQRRNEYFLPLSLLLLWATQFSFAIESWRRRRGASVPGWVEQFAEFEALCALAAYSFEHPDDPFPEIVEGATLIEGEELRHPLLPKSNCVPNSVRLGNGLQVLIISGSNMSGKSTLLRTVGVNVALAQAGAPVRANRLKLSLVAIGATLRIEDSLQAGASRFYAEIQRLHDTMKLTDGKLPVLFLFDEILHGTNSHDRAIGAEAVIRALVDRHALGLVTTHDLALARLAEAMAPRAANVHFQDEMVNGRMVFDYVLHQGVVQKSNALELMRAVGLQV